MVRLAKDREKAADKPSKFSKVLPLVDLKKPIMLPREGDPRLLETAKSMINPDRSYTLTEAAVLSYIPRNLWKSWAFPSGSRPPRIETTRSNGKAMVKGSDILEVVARLSEIPPKTRYLRELSDLLGRSHEGGVIPHLIHRGDERYLPYVRNADGRKLLVPLYRHLDGQNLLVNEKDFTLIRNDLLIRQNLFEWPEAQNYLSSKGVDLAMAELRDRATRKIAKDSDGLHLSYESPDGTVTRIPARLVVAKAGTSRSYQFERRHIDMLADVLKRDQNRFMYAYDLLRELGLTKYQSSPLSPDGREFSVDGKSAFIKLHQRSVSGLLFIAKSDAELFKRWYSLHKIKKRYRKARMVYRGPDTRSTRINRERFIDSLEKRDGELVYPVSELYGIGLRVRELDGIYYLGAEAAELLRFYFSITHHNPKVVARATKGLLSASKSKGVLLASKLWVARDIFVSSQRPETPDERVIFKKLDELFSNPSTNKIFKKYPLDKLEQTPNPDLRFDEADQSFLLALLSVQDIDIQSQFSTMW